MILIILFSAQQFELDPMVEGMQQLHTWQFRNYTYRYSTYRQNILPYLLIPFYQLYYNKRQLIFNKQMTLIYNFRADQQRRQGLEHRRCSLVLSISARCTRQLQSVCNSKRESRISCSNGFSNRGNPPSPRQFCEIQQTLRKKHSTKVPLGSMHN